MDEAARMNRPSPDSHHTAGRLAGLVGALALGWMRRRGRRPPRHDPRKEAETANPDTRFETRDTPPWLILLLGGLAAGLIGLVVVALLLLVPDATRDQRKTPATPMPAPRLQTDPAADLRRYREEATRRLTGYGWVDRDRGIAHIPIDEAMRRLSERGIADWPAPDIPDPGQPPSSGPEAPR